MIFNLLSSLNNGYSCTSCFSIKEFVEMVKPPLDGIRVLDLSSVVVGPYVSQFLADYGASITKIEAPGGDILRKLGGPSKSGEMSPKFMNLNRNKRSIVLDLKHENANQVLTKLIESHDVFLSNVRPQALKRLGLDYPSYKKLNPKVVYCSIVGFGQKGQYKNRPAYDNVIQGSGGIAACHHRQGGRPKYMPMVVADRLTGLMACQAILVSLMYRNRDNEGIFIQVPMFESLAEFVLIEHMGQLIYPGSDGPSGDLRVLDQFAVPIETKDSFICIAANTQKQAAGLFEAIGRPELIEDERFNSVANRFKNVTQYNSIRNKALKTRVTAEWMEIFDRLDVPAMRYNTFEDLMSDPHMLDVGMFRQQEHPIEGTVYTMKQPTEFSVEWERGQTLAPGLGQHSGEIMAELGYSEGEISEMVASGVIINKPIF